MLNISSVADVFQGISKKYLEQLFKENLPMDVPYFIKENLWMSASDEAAPKKIIGGSKSSSKLTLKTKWCHKCGCRSVLQINIFLKKC